MSDLIYLIQPESLKGIFDKYKDIPAGINTNYVYKGLILYPSLDEMKQPVLWLNPVYGPPNTNKDDIIIQRNELKACPYPPGYTLAGINKK